MRCFKIISRWSRISPTSQQCELQAFEETGRANSNFVVLSVAPDWLPPGERTQTRTPWTTRGISSPKIARTATTAS